MMHPQLIQELFEKQVDTTPHRTAVICEEHQLTYAQLNRRANQLARYLKKSGVSLESRVGVCLNRSLESLVALLGIFKAGGAYVPLDPEYPAERLEYMLTDSQIRVLLTDKIHLAKLAHIPAMAICLEDAWNQIEQEAAENTAPITCGQNLAYVLYTSGSTGKPKGVMVEHRGLAKVIVAGGARFGFNENDVMPCLASFSFDISLFELCNPLCAGGTVVIWDQKDVLDVRLLVERLEGLTLLHCVPTLMRQLVNWMKENNCRAERLLRVFVGGEMVGVQLLKDMKEVFPRADVHVLYGPTEGTIICATRSVTEELTAAPVGSPIADAQLFVLDRELKLSPIGVAGELYLGGTGLARGYLNRPELTADRFIPHSFGEETGARLYRTGDLVRWNSDGNLEFVGRVDEQVKIRGHRIEVGEIENTLQQCPGIAEAVVTIRQDQPGQERLVAYVVSDSANRPVLRNSGEIWFSPAIHDYIYDASPLTARGETRTTAHPFYQPVTENVRNRTVLIAGTLEDKLLLKACVEGGAKCVYVADFNAAAHASTRSFIERSNFAHVVPFLLGAEAPAIEDRVDFCLTDLFGDVGGSKGVEIGLQQLRTALGPETIFYPQSCPTHISAVELSECAAEFAVEDAREIFAATGYPFDLRVRVHQLAPENVISDESIFEEINCFDPHFVGTEATDQQIQLTITRDASLCGFALTLKLSGDMTGRGRYDCCYTADAPVFLPVFAPALQVEAGDRIEASCVRRLSAEDSLRQDYLLQGRILYRRGEVKQFLYRIPFIQRVFEGSQFYKKLFSKTSIEELVSGAQQSADRDITRELFKTLKSKLPDYMLPSAIVKLEQFPLTPNGKLDRHALPPPKFFQDPTAPAPVGRQQEVLCSLFANTLGLPQVSLEDSFFDLGGDSLMVIQLVTHIRTELGFDLPIRTFFEAPTVAGLSQRLGAIQM